MLIWSGNGAMDTKGNVILEELVLDAFNIFYYYNLV